MDDDLFAGIFEVNPLSIGGGAASLDKQIVEWEASKVPLPSTPPLPVRTEESPPPPPTEESPPPPTVACPSPRQSRSRSPRRVLPPQQPCIDPRIELETMRIYNHWALPLADRLQAIRTTRFQTCKLTRNMICEAAGHGMGSESVSWQAPLPFHQTKQLKTYAHTQQAHTHADKIK